MRPVSGQVAVMSVIGMNSLSASEATTSTASSPDPMAFTPSGTPPATAYWTLLGHHTSSNQLVRSSECGRVSVCREILQCIRQLGRRLRAIKYSRPTAMPLLAFDSGPCIAMRGQWQCIVFVLYSRHCRYVPVKVLPGGLHRLQVSHQEACQLRSLSWARRLLT